MILVDADFETEATLSLARELRVVIGRLRRRLRAQSHPGGLTPSQLAVLFRLDRDGPATVTALARAEGVRPQSLGATVAALEAAGMVAGSPHPTDGRQTMLRLTDACRDWIAADRAAREDWLSHAIRDHLDPGEQRTLADAVELLGRLAGS